MEVPSDRTLEPDGDLRIEAGGGVAMGSGFTRANMPPENLSELQQSVAIREETMAPGGRMK